MRAISARWSCLTIAVGVLAGCSETSTGTTGLGVSPPTSPPGVTSSSAETTATNPTTSSSSSISTIPLATEFPATRSDSGLGWESVEIPTALVALCHRAVVATDTELVFWGGDDRACDYESPKGDPGMAYNPDSGMWRQLPASPLKPAVAPTGVWTGSEVIICCGMTGLRQAAAYNPADDTWRVVADPPLIGPKFAKSVWTGAEMLVVTQQGALSYDPATDEWRSFASPPQGLGWTNEIAWTGSELIVWPSTVERRVHQGLALDPEVDSWTVLPDPPAWPAALSIAYTGDALIIWGGLPAHFVGSERAVGSKLDLDTDTWTEIPEALPEPDGCECNLGSQTLTWTGEYVLVSPGMFSTGIDPAKPVLLAYHPDSDTWILVDDDSPIGGGGRSLSLGQRLVMLYDRIFSVSPPGWQPTGRFITADSWNE